jgi:uncharacterized membrane protein
MLVILKAMKAAVFLVSMALIACGGSLSDEQRKEMREKMEMNKIVRVTEVEITEAAFSKGRQTIKHLEQLKSDSAELISYLEINRDRIRFIRPGASTARALEQQLLEAYLADTSGSSSDNVQKVRNDQGDFDSMLYTKPEIEKMQDGTTKLRGLWSIWMGKKELVLEIGKNKD